MGAADVPEIAGADASVDVWVVDLTDVAIDEARALEVLDPKERQSADARSGAGRRRFVASHFALRTILASILTVDPREVHFGHTCGRCGAHDHGRPWALGAGSLSFSLSHSGERSIIAVAYGVRIGADIEEARRRVHLDRLARRALSRDEHADWSALPDRGALVAFLGYWTAKEAYLKATGEGISRPLADVPGVAPQGWSLARPDVGDRHVAAVVAAAPAIRVRQHSWRGDDSGQPPGV